MTNRKSPLRAVEPGEKAESTEPKLLLSILEAAEAEDRLEELRAMRRRIAKTLDDSSTPARDLASLTRRQIEIGREVAVLLAQARQEANQDDEVTDSEFDASAV